MCTQPTACLQLEWQCETTHSAGAFHFPSWGLVYFYLFCRSGGVVPLDVPFESSAEISVEFCREGGARGPFIVAIRLPDAVDRAGNVVPSDPEWVVYFSGPAHVYGVLATDPFILTEMDILDLETELRIEWAPSSEPAASVVSRLFPQLNPNFGGLSRGEGGQPSGPSRGWSGLLELLSAVERTSTVDAEYASRELPPKLDDLAKSKSVEKSVVQISILLESYGYALSVMPLANSEVTDPWEPFR